MGGYIKIPGNSMNIPEYFRDYIEMIDYSGKVDIIHYSPGIYHHNPRPYCFQSIDILQYQ
jgi:hypothetical protein